MSRIGNQPIDMPANMQVEINPKNSISIKGPKGRLVQAIEPAITVTIAEGKLLIQRKTEQKTHKALHGLYRALLQNMVIGVTQGFKKSLEIVGLGYKASVTNGILELHVGKSHMIHMAMPYEIDISVETTKGKNARIYIHVEGIDKQLVGQVAAKIRDQKPPEAYISKRGVQKGIRYVNELLIGKTKKDGK